MVYLRIVDSLQLMRPYFSVVHNVNRSSFGLNENLVKISEWAYYLKTSFNPDPTNQGEDVIFSSKLKIASHLLKGI